MTVINSFASVLFLLIICNGCLPAQPDCKLGVPEFQLKGKVKKQTIAYTDGNLDNSTWSIREIDRQGRVIRSSEIGGNDGYITTDRKQKLNVPPLPQRQPFTPKPRDTIILTNHYDEDGRLVKKEKTLRNVLVGKTDYDYSNQNMVKSVKYEFEKSHDSIRVTEVLYNNCEKVEQRSYKDGAKVPFMTSEYWTREKYSVFTHRDGERTKISDISFSDDVVRRTRYLKSGKTKKSTTTYVTEAYDSMGNPLLITITNETKDRETVRSYKLFDYEYYDKLTPTSTDTAPLCDALLADFKTGTLSFDNCADLTEFVQMHVKTGGYGYIFKQDQVDKLRDGIQRLMSEFIKRHGFNTELLSVAKCSMEKKIHNGHTIGLLTLVVTDGVVTKRFRHLIPVFWFGTRWKLIGLSY